MMSYEEMVLGIAGDPDTAQKWRSLNAKVYFKGKEPHGLMAMLDGGDRTLIAAAAKDDVFTLGMLRAIARVYFSGSVELITDKPSAFEHIRTVLAPYGFTFIEHEFEAGRCMRSIHLKEN